MRPCHSWIWHIPDPQICSMTVVICVVLLYHSPIYLMHLLLSPCQVIHDTHPKRSQSFLNHTILFQLPMHLTTFPTHLLPLWGCETIYFILMSTTASCRKHHHQHPIRRILSHPTCLSLGFLHHMVLCDLPNLSRGRSDRPKAVHLYARDARAHFLGNMILNDMHVCILGIGHTYVECVRRVFREAMHCGDIFVLSVRHTNHTLLPRRLMCWSCQNENPLL